MTGAVRAAHMHNSTRALSGAHSAIANVVTKAQNGRTYATNYLDIPRKYKTSRGYDASAAIV